MALKFNISLKHPATNTGLSDAGFKVFLFGYNGAPSKTFTGTTGADGTALLDTGETNPTGREDFQVSFSAPPGVVIAPLPRSYFPAAVNVYINGSAGSAPVNVVTLWEFASLEASGSTLSIEQTSAAVSRLESSGAVLTGVYDVPAPTGAIGHPTLTLATTWGRVKVVNSFGDPVESADYEIELGEGRFLYGRTGADGIIELHTKEARKITVYKGCYDGASLLLNWDTITPKTTTLLKFIIPPCISENPLNELNLLRWYEASNFSLPAPVLPLVCVTDCDGDPFASLLTYSEKLAAHTPLPVVYKDNVSFFINSAHDLNYTDFAGMSIGILSCIDLVTPTAGTLRRVESGGQGGYKIFGKVTIPPLQDGLYNLVIYRLNTKNVLLVSSLIEVVNFKDWKNETVKIKYRHSRNIANYLYNEIDPEFYNEFRIPARLSNEQTPEERASYIDMNGLSRDTKNKLIRTVELVTDEMDSLSHTSLAFALTQREKKIDNRAYTVDGGYEREGYAYEGSPLSMAKVKLIDQDFTRSINYC